MVLANYYVDQDPRIFTKEFNQSIPEFFEGVVAQYSNSLAVKSVRGEYSYRSLNNISNQIARVINSKLSTSDKPIAILMHKDHRVMAAMMAVLKSGNFYVPLAASDPSARLVSILDDCQPGLILTDTDHLAQISAIAPPSTAILSIDQVDTGLDDTNLSKSIGPDALAHIIYTSGSSGIPKGVTQTHRNLRHLVNNYAEFISVKPQDRLTWMSPFSHSASVMDIFSALLYGASLFPYDVYSQGVNGIKPWLLDEKITIYHSVPTLYRAFTSQLDGKEKFPDIRVVDMGGETVYAEDVDAYKRNFSDACVFANGMGSTELVVIFRCVVTKAYPNNHKIMPIGYPVYGVDYMLLDENGEEVGEGDVGEIVYTSPALTPGYWHKPEENIQKFRILPGWGDKRWYFTGDLAHKTEEGYLVFSERKDLQIKIRGFRVEPREIELALEEHPSIQQAIVVDYEKQSKVNGLAAFLIPSGQGIPGNQILREYLRHSKPDYMLPEQFYNIEKYPLTATGKLDRNALRTMAAEEFHTNADSRKPKPGLEADLLSLWRSALKNPDVGLEDIFFDLGGDSLIALQLAFQMNKKLGIDLPINFLFQAPTVQDLAKRIQSGAQLSPGIQVHPLKTSGSLTPFFLVSPTVIDVITYYDLARYLDSQQPLYVLYSQVGGGFREIIPNGSEDLENLVSAVKKYQPTGPYLIGGYSAGGRAALNIAHQLEADGNKVDLVLMMDTFAPGYPQLKSWVSPRIFNIFKILRRVQSYMWKFWILDWEGKRKLLLSKEKPLTSRVSDWIGNRANELKKANLKEKHQVGYQSFSGGYEDIHADVALFRAKRGLIGVVKDHSLGWQGVFGERVEVIEVPGDHEAILFGPRIEKIGRLIQSCLVRAGCGNKD